MRTLAKTLSLLSAIFMLVACGGGGAVSRDDDNGTGGNGGGVTPTNSISLSLENASGAADNNLTESNPLTVVASVVNSNGEAQSDLLLTFTLSDPSLAEFGNDTGTARTDSNGVARLNLRASTASGDGEITATLSSGESGTTTFSAQAVTTTTPPTVSVDLTLQNADGDADSDLTANNPLTAVAVVTDSNGDPQADILLTFSLSNEDLAVFSNDTGTARTNAEGVAALGLSVGEASGDGALTVTLPSGETDITTFSSAGSTTVSEEPASLELFASSVQLATSGSDDIELIALVKNEQSVLMEGVSVSFSAQTNAGVELQLTQPQTAADGTARALLSTQNNASNRDVVITASAGSFSETVTIAIVGTEVTITGSNSAVLNDSIEYTIRVQDSDGVSILNQDVILSAENGTLGETTVNTGANGQAVVTYTATTSGEDTITASALNASSNFTLQVQQDEFGFVNLPEQEIPVGTLQAITVQWRQDNNPVSGENITFSVSRGEIDGSSTATTDANGQATIQVRSTNAGISSITATGTDSNGNTVVSAVTQVEFIAITPHTLIADASPDILGPDGQTSTISAVVRDVDGNLVKNTVVNFSVSDISTGFVSPSQATTDSKGIANTVFTSGSVSSQEAVVITAFVADDEAIADDVVLTVGNRAFDISIGTGNIIESPTTTSYLKRFGVFVSDSVGQPVSGVALTASVTPVKYNANGEYRTGFWSYDDLDSIWVANIVQRCQNEDVNDNGILDTSPTSEDTNDDGLLTPGVIGTISFAGNAVTDENGYAELEYRYPRSYAVWYDAVVTVFGQSTGSEAQAHVNYTLGIAGEDLTDEGASPPANPFGITDQCTDVTP